MKIEPILINVVLFSCIAILLGSYVVDLNESYQLTGNYTTDDDWEQFEESFSYMENQSMEIQNHTVGFYTKDLTDPTKYTDALMAFVDVGAILLTMPATVFRYIGYADSVLGVYIPTVFLRTIYVVIVLIFTFRVVSIFVKPGDDV